MQIPPRFAHWPTPLTSYISHRFVSPSPLLPLYQTTFASTNEPILAYSPAGAAQVDAAVQAAVAAQPAWARKTPAERGRILIEAARLLTARTRELAWLETLNTSRAISETRVVDIKSASDCLEYFGGSAAVQQVGETHAQPLGALAYTLREPLGVAAGIGAFNYPLQSAAWKAAPALAFGNALVFKPAEDTPMTALALAEALAEAGLPEGLFSVVLGGKETGEALCRHPEIAKISFTGSEATGAAIAREASPQLKRLTLELGGKSPLIVFDDADLDEAVAAALLANFYSNGEVCSNATRVFVHESVYDDFLERFTRRARLLRLGDPRREDVDVGALINSRHQSKVLGFIQRALTEGGARLVCGGRWELLRVRELTSPRAPSAAELGGDETLARGAFVLPTILACDRRDDLEVCREEVFGPVACVLKFASEDEVLSRANRTRFGLSAGVFTRNLGRAHRMAAGLHAGGVYVNNYNLAPVEIPWGGNKMSGIGRENGTEALHGWTQVKTVYIETGQVADPYRR